MNQTIVLSLMLLALCLALMYSIGRRVGHLEVWCGIAAVAAAMSALAIVESIRPDNSISSAIAGANAFIALGFGSAASVPLANYVRRLIARWRPAQTESRAPDSQR